jgi:hypothetical protein
MTDWLVLDIHCGPCRRAGDKNPPRLARFARPATGGPVHVRPFTAEGQQVVPACRTRSDGGTTWRLVSECGHDKRIRGERIAAAFDAFRPGESSMRAYL